MFEALDGEELSPEMAIACGTLMHAHTLEVIEHILGKLEWEGRPKREGPLPFRFSSSAQG
jgi:hypothetical protein